MEGAFTGKYLRVDLSQGTTAVEQFSDVHYRMFMGGAAMAAAILMKELQPGVDPLVALAATERGGPEENAPAGAP